MGGSMSSNSPPRFQNLTRRLGLQWACLAVACCLGACGGQSGAMTGQTTGSTTLTPGGSDSTSFALAGAYQGTLYGSDFISFLTPGMDWYALYFLQTGFISGIYPDIYRGTLGSLGADSASIASPGLTAFQFKTHSTPSGLSHLTAGGASITGASAGAYDLALTGITLSNNLVPRFSATAVATFAGIDGTWLGTWADALGDIQTNSTLTISGGVANTGFGYCKTMSLALNAAAESTAHPYYLATLSIPPQTSCTRAPSGITPGVLSGIGFVHSASGGTGKRLELIVTDTTGSGISFRGDLVP